MIYDRIENFGNYEKENKLFASAGRLIKTLMSDMPENGKYVSEETGDVVAIISGYRTKDTENVLTEAHKKFIDIQIICSGEECIFVPGTETVNETEPYNTEKDRTFYGNPDEANDTRLVVKAGDFAVFFTNELHAPGAKTANGNSDVRKIVVKVKAD